MSKFYDTWERIEKRNPTLKTAARISMRPSEIKRLAKMCYDKGAKHASEDSKTDCAMPEFLRGLFKRHCY